MKHGNVIFVGTVISIENPPPEESRGYEEGESRYTFRVDDPIIGVSSSEVDVYSGRGGGDCSFHFRQGEQYLVFPGRTQNGRLYATICSETREIEEAAVLLAQLRTLRDQGTAPSVFGTLWKRQEPYQAVWQEGFDAPLAATVLQLRGEEFFLETRTDEAGEYAFHNVPAGKYSVWADLPQALTLAQRVVGDALPPIEFPTGACYELDLEALPTGLIRGSVIGPDGLPLSYARVELFLAEHYRESAPGRWESQEEEGWFKFSHVAPGNYILVFNPKDEVAPDMPYPRRYYPGVAQAAAAEAIVLREGEQRLDANIRVSSPYPTRRLTVRVDLKGYSPPKEASFWVSASGNRRNHVFGREVSHGIYELLILQSEQYTVTGNYFCGDFWQPLPGGGDSFYPIGSVEFRPVLVDGGDTRIQEVVLFPTGKDCDELRNERIRDIRIE